MELIGEIVVGGFLLAVGMVVLGLFTKFVIVPIVNWIAEL